MRGRGESRGGGGMRGVGKGREEEGKEDQQEVRWGRGMDEEK